MDIIAKIAEELKIRVKQVEAAVALIDEGNTIPFIARYRKEATGSLDDEKLRELGEKLEFYRALDARRADVQRLIDEQGKLTPELSADIIRSHAKDGYTLIRNHRLPEFLADIALEHHGTMPIRYFYAKALKMTDGELNIEDFSYMGPKPKTKLAAIIMICDASEAAVRAANARKPEDAEKAIRAVIEERMDLEQFSECDVTMADLTKIRQALVNALTGVYHHRIKYPSIKYRHTENGTKGENE